MRLAFAALLPAALSACDSLPARRPTYHTDVAPLLDRYCPDCHGANGVAPAPTLADYDSVMTYAQGIQIKVATHTMPPWAAENSGDCGTWDGARWMTDQEIATITTWQADGAPEGPLDAITVTPSRPPPFRSDAVLDIGGIYQPGIGSGGARCFVADPQLDRDHLLAAISVLSTDPRAVAQVTLFALDSDAAEAAASALDAAEPGLGYSCFGNARTPDSRLVASWTWPTPVLRMPAGTGVRLLSGRKVVVQILYDINTTGSDFKSATQVELELDDQATEAQVVPFSADGPLAPGLMSVAVENEQLAQQRMRVVGVAPRMHVRGKTMKLVAERGSGSTCLANFVEWDYHNQQLFRARNPSVVQPNDRLHISCSYETLGLTDPVVFGDGINDEECVVYLFVTN